MAEPFKKFLIITNATKDPGFLFTKRISDCLQDLGCSVDSLKPDSTEKAPESADCVITLGGDGTLINAADDPRVKGLPILGINIGTLGYLTDTDRTSAFDVLQRVVTGEYDIEHRMMLDGEVTRNGKVRYRNSALNDIVLNRQKDMSVMDFDIYFNGDFLTGYTADGAIIATATGSTAYSLSCGGPFIEPSTKVIMVTPICAHSLTGRSIIVDENTRISIRLRDRDYRARTDRGVWFDGQYCVDVQTGDEISVCRSSQETLLVRTTHCGFVQRLREKL